MCRVPGQWFRTDVRLFVNGRDRTKLVEGVARQVAAVTAALAGTRWDGVPISGCLCFVDTQLPPDYTAVGTVDEAGLAVLDQIAAAGNDGSFEPSPGGGAPNTPVTLETVSVVA